MFFFYFFLFASIILGTFNLGPFSIRVYMTVLMLFFLVLKITAKKSYKLPKPFIFTFFLYLIVTASVLSLNGEYEEYDFTKLFLARFLNCIVTYFAIDYFVKDESLLKKTIVFLIALITLNCIITILQYLGSPIGHAIGLLLITSSEVKADIEATDLNSLFSADLTIGLFNFTFINAMIIAVVGVLIVGLYGVTKKTTYKVLLLGLLALFVFSCLATQGRTPFILFVIFSLYLFLKNGQNNLALSIVAALVIVVVLINLPSLIDSDSLGRILDSNKYEYDPRKVIWDDAMYFIGNHLLLGGPVSFLSVNPAGPHNYFLNAFITSGIVGGIIATFLFIIVCWQAFLALISKHSLILASLGASILIYMANTLFHNASMISGDTVFFVMYGLLMKASLIYKDNNIYKHKYETNNNCRPLCN